jgi:catechol 2,3-dioxygenase-like lactoylglutathione lyase family enzyme
MLVDHPMTLTIPVSDLERARVWYCDKLGFNPVHEVPGEALAYRTGSGQSLLLVSSGEAGAVEHQLAAWRIALTPVGRAAWFKDSEGNVLTISQLS